MTMTTTDSVQRATIRTCVAAKSIAFSTRFPEAVENAGVAGALRFGALAFLGDYDLRPKVALGMDDFLDQVGQRQGTDDFTRLAAQ